MAPELILQVENLKTTFDTEEGSVCAVEDISFSIEKGQTLGLVGESGCGKSVTALSIMRLLPKPAGQIVSGTIRFKGIDLVQLSNDELFPIRGNRISMIFQEPMTALNPVHKIGKQLIEVFQLHQPDLTYGKMQKASINLLENVGIPDPEKRMGEYPHQISGGMRQRVMIAIALACRPDILIADEPTTALDVTIQAQILDLIKDLQNETGMAVIFITHDLGVIAEICDKVVVMYAGKIAETAPIKDLFHQPAHPYTVGLLNSIPRLDSKRKSKLNIIKGIVPSLSNLPKGCRFQNRCSKAQTICHSPPPFFQVGDQHYASCHFVNPIDGEK